MDCCIFHLHSFFELLLWKFLFRIITVTLNGRSYLVIHKDASGTRHGPIPAWHSTTHGEKFLIEKFQNGKSAVRVWGPHLTGGISGEKCRKRGCHVLARSSSRLNENSSAREVTRRPLPLPLPLSSFSRFIVYFTNDPNTVIRESINNSIGYIERAHAS